VYTTNGVPYRLNQPDIRLARVPTRGSTDVSVELTGLPDRMAQGTEAEITATVTNHGANAAEAAFLEVALPGQLVARGATASGGTCYGVTHVTCRLAPIPAGADVDVTFSAFATGTDAAATTAAVTTGTLDPDQDDNSETVSTTVDPAQTATVAKTTGDIDKAIRNDAIVDIPFTVRRPGRVLDVDASVRLDHDHANYLVLQLISPDGTVVTLAHSHAYDSYGDGTQDCAGTPTVFDDSAATPISQGWPPFAGSFRPDQPLSGIAGEAADGMWILRIVDTAFSQPYVPGHVYCVNLTVLQTR
jgi:subtilisin-like proprotein convertase family protein